MSENSLEWWAIVRKKRLDEIKRFKKLIEQRKMRLWPGYRTDRFLICNPGTLKRKKRQLWKKRNSRRSHGKSLIVVWIPTTFRHTKYFSRTSAVYVAKDRVSRTLIKDSAGNNLTDENEILSRWREYFEDL